MQSIIFAVIALCGWGTGDVGGVIAARRLGSVRATTMVFIWTTLLLTLFIPFNSIRLSTLLSGYSLFNCLLGLILIGCYIAFVEALRTGNPSIIGTICGGFPALVIVLSIIFLGDHLDKRQVVIIVSIFAGLFLSSFDAQAARATKVHLDRSIFLALVTLCGWGIYFTFVKIPIRHIGPFWTFYLQNILGCIILVLWNRGRDLRFRKKEALGHWAAAGAAVAGGGGTVAYYIAVAHGSTALVAGIAGPYPVLFVLLSSLVFKQKITRIQNIGMIITLVGISALALTSSLTT